MYIGCVYNCVECVYIYINIYVYVYIYTYIYIYIYMLLCGFCFRFVDNTMLCMLAEHLETIR